MNYKSIDNPNQFRQNIRNKFNQLFFNDIKLSNNIEIATYNWAIQKAKSLKIIRSWDSPYFIQIYLNRLKTIYSNLNQNFILKIKNNELKPQDFVFMTHYELCPDKWNYMIDLKRKRDSDKFVSKMKANTNLYKCKTCKSNEIYMYELQTRSCDESATIFCQCVKCGTRWKM